MAFEQEQLNKILSEIFEKAPQLKKEQGVLLKIIKKLMLGQPKITANSQFKHNLRARLVKIAAKREAKQSQFVFSWTLADFVRSFAFSAAVIALILVIAVPLLSQKGQEAGKETLDLQAPALEKMESRGAAEFGTSGLELEELAEKTATSLDIFAPDIPSVQPAGE